MKLEIELQPFTVPNFAIGQRPARPREEGFHPSEPYPLKEVPKETLEAMCAEFRREVMRKAGYDP